EQPDRRRDDGVEGNEREQDEANVDREVALAEVGAVERPAGQRRGDRLIEEEGRVPRVDREREVPPEEDSKEEDGRKQRRADASRRRDGRKAGPPEPRERPRPVPVKDPV